MSQLVHHQDPVTELMQVFDTVFRLVMPGPGREIVGFKGISEKLRGAPGWYLWFEERPGAYLLELVEAENVPERGNDPAGRRSGARGTYWIKYYPAVDDPGSLHAFSRFEQEVRKGESFDGTGTPDFDRGCDIPEASFLIGAMEVSLSAGSDHFSLNLQSPDRWLTFTTGQNEVGTAAKVRRDRDLPAWDWSWFLMDRLITTVCLGYGTVPGRVSLNEEPGYTFHVNSGGIPRAVPDAAIHGHRLSASFAIHGEHSPVRAGACHTHGQERTGPEEDHSGRRLFSCEGEPSGRHPWISPEWWHIRESHADLGGALPC